MKRLIARETRVSVAGRIVAGVQTWIRDSDVRPGTGLPSIRQFDAGHGICRRPLPITQRQRRRSRSHANS
ncbi:hypothetical protein B7R78_0021210 [Ralstonia solanacearum]|uniref:hypothetical protein n=1 Tax=Ralstonia solanacearum species complex TaxID=3116862 RepID=UPI000E66F912|nr:hypothetical protein [Ralstonia solanacearum]MBT1539508.1 hypothetical protein [Ralstonia solanacearum]QOK84293.1 hypothetical protein HF906_19510 [Ralstonia solanacearum]RIJ84860.1 hypothetical protein RSP822_19290 [Ralstonia solanacearum]